MIRLETQWNFALQGVSDEECPQEQIMTVRQTSPTISEGEVYLADELDLDANSVFRPTLQAVAYGFLNVRIDSHNESALKKERVLPRD